MLRTMVLTPTKEVPNELGGGGGHSSPSDAESGKRPTDAPPSRERSIQTIETSQSTTSSRSNTIDRLQAKVIQQRLRDESTPLTRAKEAASAWLSSIMDCGLCCMDTTTVAPLDASPSSGADGGGGFGVERRGGGGASSSSSATDSSGARSIGGGGVGRTRSPTGEMLKSQGICGLSFEVESCPSIAPKTSFSI